ncbi:MAG: MFS transporter, partial [Caldilineaceae bacterium]|nr:MFS transporter [Caldilineaceae bacterium]
MTKFDWKRAFLIGFGTITISVIWPIFNTYVPILLQAGNPLWLGDATLNSARNTAVQGFGLAPVLAFFIMTWDNILHALLAQWIGARSDSTWTRFGRRKPWLLLGVPLALVGFLLIPIAPTLLLVITGILLTNLGTALYRTPIMAWLSDLFPPEQRSKASGVNNLMRGGTAILVLMVGGILFQRYGINAPFLFTALILLLATAIAAIGVNEPRRLAIDVTDAVDNANARVAQIVRASQTTGNRNRLLILLVTFLAFTAYTALETGHSSFAVFALGISPGQAALFAGAFVLPYIVGSVPSAYVATYLTRQYTIQIGLSIFALAGLFGYFFIATRATYLLTLVACGMGTALIFVNLVALFLDTSRSEAA